jgi:hypothetical protein
VADEGSVTLAIELVSIGSAAPAAVAVAAPSGAPLDVIPVQAGPLLTVSLTEGCEGPLEALKTAAADRTVRCHPCDEAVVRLLMGRVRRTEAALLVTASIRPGTLNVG